MAEMAFDAREVLFMALFERCLENGLSKLSIHGKPEYRSTDYSYVIPDKDGFRLVKVGTKVRGTPKNGYFWMIKAFKSGPVSKLSTNTTHRRIEGNGIDLGQFGPALQEEFFFESMRPPAQEGSQWGISTLYGAISNRRHGHRVVRE